MCVYVCMCKCACIEGLSCISILYENFLQLIFFEKRIYQQKYKCSNTALIFCMKAY